MLVNDLMRGRVLYVAELFPPRPPDCSVKKRTFPTRSYSAQTKWAGGASMKSMVQKTLLGLVFAGLLAVSAPAADVVIRLAPPRILVEKRPPRPSHNHVWVTGYHRWDGNAYQWQGRKWEEPPARHRRWVAHHYVRRNGGYVLVEGHWQ